MTTELHVLPEQIQKAIREKTAPTKIAVAYIGQDYQSFIDTSRVEAIICQPNLGTNPAAVTRLIKALAWDKVYFWITFMQRSTSASDS